MTRFIHHPDGDIYIGEDLVLPLEDFLLDEPDYVLPDGYAGREYAPGERHFLRTGIRADPQPLAWPEGDAYIARAEVYRANYEARHPVDLTQQEAAGRVNETDLAAIGAATGAASTVEDLRAQVAALAGLVGDVAVALGLAPKVDQGGIK